MLHSVGIKIFCCFKCLSVPTFQIGMIDTSMYGFDILVCKCKKHWIYGKCTNLKRLKLKDVQISIKVQ